MLVDHLPKSNLRDALRFLWLIGNCRDEASPAAISTDRLSSMSSIWRFILEIPKEPFLLQVLL
jgi:hypothetical protein